MRYYLLIFGASLALTLVFELAVGWCFGLRRWEQVKLLLLVNLLTNPAAVLLHTVFRVPQIPIEIAVISIEYYVYRQFPKQVPRPLLLAITANAISWGLGVLVQI